MIRTFDLDLYSNSVNQLLNDPSLSLNFMKINCSEETGYTTATLRLTKCEPREKKYKRFVERFVLTGSYNKELEKRMDDPDNRLIKQYVFPTFEGIVVVLDYQVRKGRQVGK